MTADRIVALIGLLAALFLVSNGSTFRSMSGRSKVLLGMVWAVIIGIVAVVASRLAR